MLGRTLRWLLAAALLAGCAGGEAVEAPAPLKATEARDRYLGFVVPEGQALLTLYRPANLLGGANTYYFAINGARTPGIDLNRRYTVELAPGPVTIEAISWPSAPKLSFVAGEGMAYFILVKPEPLLGGADLAHAEPGQAARAAAEMKVAQ